MIKKLSLLILTICGLSFWSQLSCVQPVAIAQADNVAISITPPLQHVELKPGSHYAGYLVVTNTGQVDYEVTARVTPYYVKSASYDPDFTIENSYTQMAKWIKLEQDHFQIPAGKSATLRYSLDVPKDVASGGQYVAILVKTDPIQSDTSTMAISSQLASVIYGSVTGGQIRSEGELLDHSISSLVLNGELSVSQEVKNTGNVDFRVNQKLVVRDLFTNRELFNSASVDGDTNLGGTTTVLPETSRVNVLAWHEAPTFGLFRATQTINFLDQEYIYHQLVVCCPVWLLVVLVAAVVTLIGWLIVKIVFKLR